MQKFTDLHVDSVIHRPGPKTAMTVPPKRVSVFLCKPLFEIMNKPQTVEVDLARMTKNTWNSVSKAPKLPKG